MQKVAVRCAQVVSLATEHETLQAACAECGYPVRRLVDFDAGQGDLVESFIAQLGAAYDDDGWLVASRLARGVPRLPRRTLVGRVNGYDVALARNSEGFSLVLSSAEKKKLGYVLVRVAERRLLLRGAHVSPEHRGKGLAAILLSTFVVLALRLKKRPETEILDKPVLTLALLSRGFHPVDPRFPVRVALKPEGACVVWGANVRSMFSHNFCKTQHITLGDGPPVDARLTYVKTAFVCDHFRPCATHEFCTPRLLAFLY